jgi:hypothetical protein
LIVQDPFVKLAAQAVRSLVVDDGVMVDVLLSPHHIESLQAAFAAFAGEQNCDIVPHQAASQRDRVVGQDGAARLMKLDAGEVKGAGALPL